MQTIHQFKFHKDGEDFDFEMILDEKCVPTVNITKGGVRYKILGGRCVLKIDVNAGIMLDLENVRMEPETKNKPLPIPDLPKTNTDAVKPQIIFKKGF